MRRVLPWVLLGAFLALAVVGLACGSMRPIFMKAIRVCRECIGIG